MDDETFTDLVFIQKSLSSVSLNFENNIKDLGDMVISFLGYGHDHTEEELKNAQEERMDFLRSYLELTNNKLDKNISALLSTSSPLSKVYVREIDRLHAKKQSEQDDKN